MQVMNFLICVICIVLAALFSYRSITMPVKAVEFQILTFSFVFTGIIAVAGSIETANAFENTLFQEFVLILAGINVMLAIPLFGSIVGIAFSAKQYIPIIELYMIFATLMVGLQGWSSLVTVNEGVLAWRLVGIQNLIEGLTKLMSSYILILVACMIAWGIALFVSSDKGTPLKRRSCFMIGNSVFMELVLIGYVLDSANRQSLLVGGMVVSLVSQFYFCERFGTYNIEHHVQNALEYEMRDGVFMLDHNGCFIKANEIAQEILPELRNAVPKKTKLTELIDRIDGEMQKTSNHTYKADVRAAYNEELFIGTVVYLYDITEEEKRYHEMEQRKRQMEKEADWNKTMVSMITHEVRTPLNAVIGAAELAKEKETDPQQKIYLESITKYSWSLLKRISMFLNMARITWGNYKQTEQKYRMDEKLYDFFHMAELLLRGKNVNLRTDLDPNIPRGLVGNIEMLEIVAINLMSNAIKYTKQGEIVFRVSYEMLGGEHIRFRAEIEDTGCGIKEEDQERIFRMFERVKEDNVEGYGVGLATVAHVANLLGASLIFHSEYGKGSTFGIELDQKIYDKTPIGMISKDIAPYENDSVAVPIEKKYYSWPGARVLVVDDMEINVEVLEHMISEYGVHVEVAKGEDEAYDLYRAIDFQIVFLDYMLENTTGLEMMRMMKQIRPDASAAFVIVTANADDEQKEYFKAQEFNGYLWKPVQQRRVEYLLNKFIPKEYRTEQTQRAKVYAGKAYLVPIFTREVSKILDEIPGYLQNEDYGLLATKVHGIKGACREIGFSDFASYAQVIEDDLKDRHLDGMHDIIKEFAERAQQLLASVQSEYAQEPQENNDVQDQVGAQTVISSELFEEIKNALGGYDYDAARNALNEALRLTAGERAKMLHDAKIQLEDLEYEKSLELVRKCEADYVEL